MNTTARVAVRSSVLRTRWFMASAWFVIALKCVVVTWAVKHWHMPFSATWVVLPTLAFAALATALWAAHKE